MNCTEPDRGNRELSENGCIGGSGCVVSCMCIRGECTTSNDATLWRYGSLDQAPVSGEPELFFVNVTKYIPSMPVSHLQ